MQHSSTPNRRRCRYKKRDKTCWSLFLKQFQVSFTFLVWNTVIGYTIQKNSHLLTWSHSNYTSADSAPSNLFMHWFLLSISILQQIPGESNDQCIILKITFFVLTIFLPLMLDAVHLKDALRPSVAFVTVTFSPSGKPVFTRFEEEVESETGFKGRPAFIEDSSQPVIRLMLCFFSNTRDFRQSSLQLM